MQKQTFKLPKHLALGFAALMIAIMPEANAYAQAAGSWGFGVQANLLGTFRPTKPKIKNNDKTKSTTGNKIGVQLLAEAAGQELKKDELELDLENVNFGNSLAIGVAFSGIYQVNDMFGIGGIAEIGISFHKEQWKALKSLTLSEGFFAKIGVAMTITEWFMISAGIRMSYLTADITLSDEDKRAIAERNAKKQGGGQTLKTLARQALESNVVPFLDKDGEVNAGRLDGAAKVLGNHRIARAKAEATVEKPYTAAQDEGIRNKAKADLEKQLNEGAEQYKAILSDDVFDELRKATSGATTASDPVSKDLSNMSSSTWAFSFYVDAKVFIPLMGDNLKAVITVGFYTDIFAPNFTNWTGSGSDQDTKDEGIELHGRTGFQAGIGIAYMF